MRADKVCLLVLLSKDVSTWLETDESSFQIGRVYFLGQMVSVGNYRGVVSLSDKIFYVGPSTHT